MFQKQITDFDIDNAYTALSQINEHYFRNYQVLSEPIKNKKFTQNINLQALVKPQFNNCDFISSNFIGMGLSSSFFVKSNLKNCNIDNSNLKFSSFIMSDIKNSFIKSTSFDNVTFDTCKIINCDIVGCCFENTIFSKNILNCLRIKYCDFEGAILNDVKIINSDLSKIGLNFVELNNVYIENVIFPLIDMFHCYNGLQLISKFSDSIFLKIENDTISGKECLMHLDALLCFFYSKKDFMAVSNIYIFVGEHENAYFNIINGLKYSLEKKDFKMIHSLCKLASNNNFFTRKQLQDFYNLLQSDDIISQLSCYEYRYFVNEMKEIKDLLINMPFGMPQLIIEIDTNILADDYKNLSSMHKEIDRIIDTYLPQSNKYLSIRHNSPNIIEVFISDVLPNLVVFAGYFSAIMLGTTKIIKEIQTIIKNNKELKGVELDNLIKEQELEKKKIDLKKEKNNNDNINKISYYINTNLNIIPELRQNTYYKD